MQRRPDTVQSAGKTGMTKTPSANTECGIPNAAGVRQAASDLISALPGRSDSTVRVRRIPTRCLTPLQEDFAVHILVYHIP